MTENQEITTMDWHRIFSPDAPGYVWEIAFRTAFMFLFLIILLKFLSKRGVKQLSVFELAILIALGSATGDPMFYSDVPITHGVAALVMVIVLYKTITWFTGKSKFVEVLLEGTPRCLLIDGRIDYPIYKKIGLPYDKFFAELRLKGVDHLGQVRKVYLETSGEMSVYYFSDDEVRPGLQIYPEVLKGASNEIEKGGLYGCTSCGNVVDLAPGKAECPRCKHDVWGKTSEERRIQ